MIVAIAAIAALVTAIRELKQTDAAASNLQIPFRRTQGQVNSVGP